MEWTSCSLQGRVDAHILFLGLFQRKSLPNQHQCIFIYYDSNFSSISKRWDRQFKQITTWKYCSTVVFPECHSSNFSAPVTDRCPFNAVNKHGDFPTRAKKGLRRVPVRLIYLINHRFQFRCRVSFTGGTLFISKAKGGVALISLSVRLREQCRSFIANHLSSLSYYQNNGIKSLPCSITRIYRQIKSGTCHLRRLHRRRGREWAKAQMHSERHRERGLVPKVRRGYW